MSTLAAVRSSGDIEKQSQFGDEKITFHLYCSLLFKVYKVQFLNQAKCVNQFRSLCVQFTSCGVNKTMFEVLVVDVL